MKIAVWYHTKLSGEGIPREDFAVSLMTNQMHSLNKSGLSGAASEIHIGINGGDSDALLASALGPAKAMLYVHGKGSRTEIPTMVELRKWLKPGWFVFYHHSKSVTHPGERLYDNWRKCMERHCVWNWRYCVQVLQAGHDACGCHWLTPEKYPGGVASPFFGGTFWWAKSEYLMQLPELPEPTWQNRYEAESWIGRRRPYPKVMDFAPHWPDTNACA